MIRLTHIKLEPEYISAEVHPDNQAAGGFIRIRLKDQEIVKYTPAPGYGSARSAKHYAKIRLLQLLERKDIPAEATMYWY